jgi:hypothetical protein
LILLKLTPIPIIVVADVPMSKSLANGWAGGLAVGDDSLVNDN